MNHAEYFLGIAIGAVFAFWFGFIAGRASGRRQILSMIEKQIHRVK